MHCGSELDYIAWEKKSCKTPFPFHSMSHILLFTGAFCNLHHYVLGLAENERRAWGSRFQLICHIQASFLDRSFPILNFWTWLFHSFILGTVSQCLCTCCNPGVRTFLSLLLAKTVPLWTKSCIFPVKISFGQWSFSTLSENPCLKTWICKKGISESSFRHKYSRLSFLGNMLWRPGKQPLTHGFNFLCVKALETQGCCCHWWERISDIAGW